MKVTYIAHSGYMIELEQATLIFDYYSGEYPKIRGDMDLYVFVSHSHPDHYNKQIYNLFEKEGKDTYYVLSADIFKKEIEQVIASGVSEERILYIKENLEGWIGDAEVQTLRSTDIGVAFLVKLGGMCIYHAGDLNWWHWEEEGPVYCEMMKRKYQYEISKIEGEHIDVACVILDPRMSREGYLLGMDYFMKHVNADYVFPMHFFEEGYQVCQRFLEEGNMDAYKGQFMPVTKECESFQL